ncbi:hypothetical protein [Cardinium endosymbiont of Culicoides punctatus]|uniref:hypothetical protein n=1 Tax=Cardinium endosymbiont of Culicoides punctatus TaxID=2304601 RepID=UPI00105908D8|nr:hypothetical protein [Cardinium endosymbiont of Culicoides punctatus]TDG95409.1 hypothetical protein CCPUN_03850 [Cardinium endosymbiont of Culicoides punctatus]
MLVKCIKEDEERFISENRYYVVYAWVYFKGIGIYICENISDYCPYPHDLENFEIIDNRLSRYFCFGNYNTNYGIKELVPIFTFKEWAEDQYFWRQLFDSGDYTPPEYEEKARNTDYQGIFNHYKKLMDYEFFNPNLLPQVHDPENKYKIEQLDERLVMCWNCENAWEIETDNEMIECSRCHNVYVNIIIPGLSEKADLFFEKRDITSKNID